MELLHNPRLRVPDLETTWRNLEEGVNQVMTKLEAGISNEKYMQLYTSIYNYCTSSDTTATTLSAGFGSSRGGVAMKGGHLYTHLKNFLKSHLSTIRSSSDQFNEEQLLKYYTEQWERYSVASKFVHRLFSYLNRYWVTREIDENHRNVYDIYTLTLVSWRDHLFLNMNQNVMKAVLDLIEKQRNGDMIDTGLIKQVVSNFVSLGLDEADFKKSTLDIYAKHFQEPFIKATEAYYKIESEKFISENSVVDYMKKAEARLNEEETRVQSYLHISTQSALIQTCENVLIKNHLVPIQDEFQNLLDQDKIEDLMRMYGLLSRVPEGLDKLRTIFEAHVKKQGLNAVEKVAEAEPAANKDANEDGDEGGDEKPRKSTTAAATTGGKKAAGGGASAENVDPKVYVDALLMVHKKYSELVNNSFRGESGFVTSLDKACREFVNRNQVCKVGSSKSPEMLARFCDALLRKSSKVTEEGEIDDVLNSIMTVFKYVEDKDVFQKFYSKLLSKRLVNSTSASDDAEASMISKLKEACGFEYTSKLQKMFTDVSISKDLNNTFRDQMETTHGKAEIDFNVMVCGTAQWPLTPPSTPFTIPDDLYKTYERFQLFYQTKHSGRKLNWLFNTSKGELKTTYLKASKTGYTFQVSTYQMGILLQYNNATTYSWEGLMESTGLAPEVLQGQVNILVKAKVLTIASSDVKVGDAGSKYDLNMGFKSKKIRINLNMPVKSEQKAETDDTHKTVEEDRKLLIQAAIVRIMKTRKALKHSNLIEEVINQLQTRFKPKIPDIKKCIDILLEKDYIERNADNKDIYNYLA